MKHISDKDKMALRMKGKGGEFFFKNCRFCFPAIIHATSFCLCLSCFRRKSHFFVVHNFVPLLKSFETHSTHVPIISRGFSLNLTVFSHSFRFQVKPILPFRVAKQNLNFFSADAVAVRTYEGICGFHPKRKSDLSIFSLSSKLWTLIVRKRGLNIWVIKNVPVEILPFIFIVSTVTWWTCCCCCRRRRCRDVDLKLWRTLRRLKIFQKNCNSDMASKGESENGATKKQSRITKKLSRSGILSGGSFRLQDRRSPQPESSKTSLPATSTLPRISLTSSTGSSSCLLTSADDEGSDDSGATATSSSSKSSLTRLASRASDIQSYASRYLDSIRSKSRNKSVSISPSTSTFNVVSGGSKSATNSRSVSPFNPTGGGGASSRMTIIGHRLAPSFLPPPPPPPLDFSRPKSPHNLSKPTDNTRSINQR